LRILLVLEKVDFDCVERIFHGARSRLRRCGRRSRFPALL